MKLLATCSQSHAQLRSVPRAGSRRVSDSSPMSLYVKYGLLHLSCDDPKSARVFSGHYSCRRAIRGSVPEAVRDGIQHASRATNARNSGANANVAKS